MRHLLFLFIALALCSCRQGKTEAVQSSQPAAHDTLITAPDQLTPDKSAADSSRKATPVITPEMAYEGVNNYCHSEYDWSPAKDNPDIMYVTMGEPTETEHQVVFRSYTGSFVYFYVNKTSGVTRMVESVPSMNIEEETGTINLSDYLGKKN